MLRFVVCSEKSGDAMRQLAPGSPIICSNSVGLLYFNTFENPYKGLDDGYEHEPVSTNINVAAYLLWLREVCKHNIKIRYVKSASRSASRFSFARLYLFLIFCLCTMFTRVEIQFRRMP